MPYSKKTIRRMTPKARKLAHMVRELRSIEVRLQNMVYEIQSSEMWERAENRSASAIPRLEKQPELADFTDEGEGP